jgi:protein tyrosine/serine phosphatase
MKMERRFQVLALIVMAWVATSAQTAVQTPKPVPVAPASAERVKLPGLPNFGRTSQQILRGGQPNAMGFGELKKLGVQIIVNLGHEGDEIERALVQSQGMQYVRIPWRGSNNPDTAQIAEFLELVRTNPDKQIFVHCQRGAERTGVMVACYRMSVSNWTAEQALTEMEQFGFRGLWFRHLKKFVREFPSLLLRDPVLTRMRNGG